jgi:ribosomal-protein-alanine N-acetyltransferase
VAARVRALRPEDAAALQEFRAANREFLRAWEPVRDESYYTLEAAAAAIEAQQADRAADRGYAFGIFDVRGGLVGYVNLNAIVRGVFQNAYLGYAVAEAANGRGYATEAVREATRIGFEELELHRIQAAVIPRNGGSIRVLEKAGFRREGFAQRYLLINGAWEDHILFAVTSGEECVRGSGRRPRSRR